MRWRYFLFVGIIILIKRASAQSVIDHVDSGICPGEVKYGDSSWTPHHYSIYVDLKPELKSFRGEVNITGTLSTAGSRSIELHSVNLNVSTVAVNQVVLTSTNWYVNDAAGVLNIILPNDLADENKSLTVSVSYDGIFSDTGGVIMQNYDKTDKNRWIIFTHLQPNSARTVFPCIDLPKYKATFDISIRNPSGRVVLSNMPPKSNQSQIIQFQRTPRMSTYLVAFVVCDYEPVRLNQGKYSWRNITTWVPREIKGKVDIDRVAETTPQLLEALETYTGNAYSLPKLDQYVVHGGTATSGMENWGLIMYQSASLMNDREQPSTNDLAVTIAHELSHHWFGNSVTMSDWCHVWVQEALPTFLQGVILSQIDTAKTQTDPVDRMKWTARTKVMDTECFFYDESEPLIVMDSTTELFSLTRYYKGASVFHMIKSVVTPTVFQNSLRSFIRNYNNSYATGNELWTILKRQALEARIQFPNGTSLVNITETWETSPGHPVVSLVRKEDGSLWMKQTVCIQKYRMDGEWWTPITYTTNGSNPNFTDTSTKMWITPLLPADEDQPLNTTVGNNEWIIVNILGTGFYRVEYDQTTWKLLIDQLKRDHKVIPPINRAMLVDDSFHVAKNGEDLIKAFEIMEYAEREFSPLVWDAISINVNFHYGMFPDKEKAALKRYMQHLLKASLFRKVTDTSAWEAATLENTDDRWLRQLVFDLSCTMELPECFAFSTGIALKVIKGTMNENSIPHEIRRKLWCAAVEQGPSLITDYVKNAHDVEKDEAKKTTFFESLQCSKKHTKTILNLILQNSADKASLRQAVNNFLVSHWQGECEEILSFFDANKNRFVDDESQLASEFQYYVNRPPERCRKQTEQMFGLNSTDDGDSEWRDTYKTGPLEWLEKYYGVRSLNSVDDFNSIADSTKNHHHLDSKLWLVQLVKPRDSVPGWYICRTRILRTMAVTSCRPSGLHTIRGTSVEPGDSTLLALRYGAYTRG